MKPLLRFLLLLLCVGVGLYALSYLDLRVKALLHAKVAGSWQLVWYRLVFYTHTTLGAVALLSGPTQFWPDLRRRRLPLHRALGKVYVVACLLSGAAGLILAFRAEEGPVARLGFGVLAVLWLFTTSRAYGAVRRRDLRAHEAWMYRSFALTLAAVTLRLWLPLFTAGFGWPFSVAYPVVAWLCWAPNLLLAEWWFVPRAGVANAG